MSFQKNPETQLECVSLCDLFCLHRKKRMDDDKKNCNIDSAKLGILDVRLLSRVEQVYAIL